MSSTLRWLRAGYLIGSYVIESLYVPMIINQYWYGNEKPHIKITSLQFITPIMNLNDMYNTCCDMRHQYCVVGYLLLDGEWTTMNKVSNRFHSTRQFIGWSSLPDSTNVANLKTSELSSTNYKHHILWQRISWHDKLFTALFFDRNFSKE